jgi:integrase
MAVQRFRFSKASVEAIPTPDKLTFYRDSDTSALGLWVTPTGNKSYFAAVREDGKTKRTVIGKHPGIAPSVARKRAADLAAQARTGGTPVADKKQRKLIALTLGALFDLYVTNPERRKPLKESTIKEYREVLKSAWGDYWDKPATSLTEKLVKRRYFARGKVSTSRADGAWRVLKALFRWAVMEVDGIDTDPTTGIRGGQHGNRFEINRRQTVINAADLPLWWSAVQELRNRIAREYFTMLYLTGCRRNEIARLQWSDIDFRNRTFFLADTKSGVPVTLPLPDYVAELLKARKDAPDKYVFPAYNNPEDHYRTPNTAIKAVVEESGIEWTIHDLRRTFATTAESMDISIYSIKCLLNHSRKAMQQDVTGGYFVPDIKRLRGAAKKIEQRLLTLAGVSADAKVININERRA